MVFPLMNKELKFERKASIKYKVFTCFQTTVMPLHLTALKFSFLLTLTKNFRPSTCLFGIQGTD